MRKTLKYLILAVSFFIFFSISSNALAATSNFYSAPGDGYLENGYNSIWTAVRDAISATGVDYTATVGLDTGSFFDPTD
ncbi:MAG: hypothetical protein AAB596_01970, partial [Patescibacteria group bacterium]